MGLKKCLYCGTELSEYAVVCTNDKCKVVKPFDKIKMKIAEEEQTFHNEYLKIVNSTTPCKECGADIIISEILSCAPYNKYVCKKCGYPNISIKCQSCDKDSTTYDAYQKKFACKEHIYHTCSDCGIKVNGSDQVSGYSGGGCGSSYTFYCYCRRCAQKYPGHRQGWGCLATMTLYIMIMIILAC